jgi:hypothetical protein
MLRNAFDTLSTESALRKIANLLTFARDANDRIRVAVDTGTVAVYNRNSSTGLQGNDSPTAFSNHSWNMQDARETQKIQMKLNADMIKRNRWTY